MINETIIPIIQPKKVRMTFSIINCPTNVIPDAPNALRTPISDERSIMRLIFILIKLSVGKSINNNTKIEMINASLLIFPLLGSPNGVALKKLAT